MPGVERILIPYNILLFAMLLVTARLTPKSETMRLSRQMDPVLSVRVPNRVNVSIEYDGNMPVRCRLRDEPPPDFDTTREELQLTLEPERTREFHYHVTPYRRGSDYWRGTYVRIVAPLGLAEIQYKLATERPVRIYPNVLALREFDLLKQKGRLNLMGLRRTRIKGLGTEFESLRDYNEDDYRRIDWKSTARRGKLVVREFEQERNQAVIVCLDIGRHMLSEVNGVAKLDHALDSCLMLMHAAQVAGDQVGLMVFADSVRRYIPPRKGRNQAGFILDAVHGLEAEATAADYTAAFGYLASRWKRRSLIVVFTDAEDEAQAAEMAAALTPLTRRHLLMLVRVSDPRLKELTGLEVQTAQDLYKKAAALWYSSDRRRADARFRISGVQNIDSEPQDLSNALVTAYLRVKETSAL